ncbi:MAG: discoidin domain-containing protein [Alistipes sp.]|nr:discoidin domain-containing protein [Alistipes sp.]
MTMNVWFARDAQTVLDAIPHAVGNVKGVKASHTFELDNVLAAADGKQPSNSHDDSIARWTSWPQKGEAQWIELELKKEQEIESVSVYWYDDKGGVQLPTEWSLEYRTAGEWKPWVLYNTDNYNLFADQYNMVHPAEPIKADAVRINMTPKADATVGILEVVIE